MVKTGEFRSPRDYEIVDRRTVIVTGLAVAIAIGAGLAAQFLTALIGLITNVSFYGRISAKFVDPAGAHPHEVCIFSSPSNRRNRECRPIRYGLQLSPADLQLTAD